MSTVTGRREPFAEHFGNPLNQRHAAMNDGRLIEGGRLFLMLSRYCSIHREVRARTQIGALLVIETVRLK